MHKKFKKKKLKIIRKSYVKLLKLYINFLNKHDVESKSFIVINVIVFNHLFIYFKSMYLKSIIYLIPTYIHLFYSLSLNYYFSIQYAKYIGILKIH